MRRQSGLLRLAVACVGLLVLAAAVSAQTVFINDSANDTDTDDDILTENPPAPTGSLPVLFVHGHGGFFGALSSTPNYKKNWQNSLGSLPSFKQTLAQNPDLNIEPYYIDLPETNGRSIDDDAAAISNAVDLILHRHNANYAYPHTRTQTPTVQVVIIAYSKGTLSARKYLKTVDDDNQADMVNPDFHPVSEFIAIAPPNHGISVKPLLPVTNLSVKQLYNGKKFDDPGAAQCTDLFETAARGYIGSFTGTPIESLNGHDIADSIAVAPDQFFPSEAPGSRSPDSSASTPGTLYVTLFAHNNRDFVGGLTPSTDCPAADGRRLARNLARDAINIEVPEVSNSSNTFGIPNNSPVAVHQNTVHTPEVICKALYAAVHHRSPACAVCALDVSGKPVIPLQVGATAMLVLDFSGSMAAPACAGCATPSRTQLLTDTVQEFLDLWAALREEDNDHLGVTYFRTQVTQFHLPSTNEVLPEFPAAHNDIVADLTGLNQTPRNGTAMGGGLQIAITALRDPAVAAQVRRVILFTDGMQNVSPMVVMNASNQLVIADDPSRPPSGVSATSPETILNRALCIPIDTIGIGAGEAFVAPLQDIANATGGRNWITTAPAAEVSEIFLQELINAMRGFSPQLVAYRRGVLAANGSTEAFAIEDGVRKLVLKVSWKRGESMDFTVAKDGVDVTKAGRVINGPFYKIFALDLPSKGGITARGNWQLRISGKAATAYDTAAIIDGGRLAYDAMFDSPRPRTGGPLDLVIRLTADGQPIRGNAKVTVNLMSPTISVGDIIATIKPKELKAYEPGTSRAEAQMLALTQDPKLLAALKPKSQTFVLKATEKGAFRTQFRPEIAGNYTAFITIEGDDDKLGHFSRTQTITTVVRSAPAKLKERDAFVSQTNAGGGWRYVTLTLSPRDKRGRLIGPGLASAITLELSGGRRIGGIHDLGDGSYMLVLARPPGDDPTINLKISGDELFSGRLSKLSGK